MKLSRKSTKVEVPSVAMGDIAFNLIIFFVILAKATDDSHLPWTPAVTPKVERSAEPRARIIVDKDNKLYLNGQETGIASLAGKLDEALAQAPAGKRAVHLKVHRDILAQRFEPVIEAINEAGGEMWHIVDEDRSLP